MRTSLQIAWAADSVAERRQQLRGECAGRGYSRIADPLRDALVTQICELQGASGGVAVTSGMAALNFTLTALVPYSTPERRPLVLYAANTFYECARRIQHLSRRMGFDCLMVTTTDLDILASQLVAIPDPDSICMLWMEAIANPSVAVADISAISKLVKQFNPLALVAVDNTALPCLQQSLSHGADIEALSLSKYHSQGCVHGGAVLANNPELICLLHGDLPDFGISLGVQDVVSLLGRLSGLKERMVQQCENAHQLALLLRGHPAVAEVYYPTLSASHQPLIARQMQGFGGGIVSFQLAGGQVAGDHLMDLLEKRSGTLSITPTFGASTTHIEHYRTFMMDGYPSGFCRMAVGLESVVSIWGMLGSFLDVLAAG
jgi:cystathionine beta-lyase/cystathionine gamma-synthase